MATRHTTAPTPPLPEPTRYFAVPGFDTDTITVQYFHRHDSYGHRDVIEYAGTPDALLASGTVTADTLAIRARVLPRVPRRGRNGCRVVGSWRHTRDGIECPPYQWFRVTRVAVNDCPESLPYGREAVEAYEAWRQWNDAPVAEHRWPQPRLMARNARPEVRS